MLAKTAFELLTDLVNSSRNTKTAQGQPGKASNPNSPPQQTVDTSRYFDAESINASPLTLREKLVRSVLHTYSADVP